jgi:hypothetical protein
MNFCDLPPDPECPLRLKPGVAKIMLEDEIYQGVSTGDLIIYARSKLKSTTADRATAIAVLRGAY